MSVPLGMPIKVHEMIAVVAGAKATNSFRPFSIFFVPADNEDLGDAAGHHASVVDPDEDQLGHRAMEAKTVALGYTIVPPSGHADGDDGAHSIGTDAGTPKTELPWLSKNGPICGSSHLGDAGYPLAGGRMGGP